MDWINSITTSDITAAATTLTVFTTFLLYFQIRADHKRSRRERALELMKFWQSRQDDNAPYFICGKRLLRTLTPYQCTVLRDGGELVIGSEHKHMLDIFRTAIHQKFALSRSRKEPAGFALSELELICLRSLGIRYFNDLEIVATAWRNNIADRKIIEEEFQLMYTGESGTAFLYQDLLDASYPYPSLKYMVKAIKEVEERKVKTRKPTA
jgi:hypothetical protein